MNWFLSLVNLIKLYSHEILGTEGLLYSEVVGGFYIGEVASSLETVVCVDLRQCPEGLKGSKAQGEVDRR